MILPQLVLLFFSINMAQASILSDWFDFSDEMSPAEQTQAVLDQADDLLELQRETVEKSNTLSKIKWQSPKVIPLKQTENTIDSVFLVSQTGSTLTSKTHAVTAIVRISKDAVESSLPVSLDQVLEHIPTQHAENLQIKDSNG